MVRAAHCGAFDLKIGAFDLKITSHLSIIAVLSCNFLKCFVSVRVSASTLLFFLILHFITNLQLRAEIDRIPCFHRLSIIRSTYISCCFFLSLPFFSYLSFVIFLFFFSPLSFLSYLSYLFYVFCSEAVLKALNTLPKKESRAITERLGLGETSCV